MKAANSYWFLISENLTVSQRHLSMAINVNVIIKKTHRVL